MYIMHALCANTYSSKVACWPGALASPPEASAGPSRSLRKPPRLRIFTQSSLTWASDGPGRHSDDAGLRGAFAGASAGRPQPNRGLATELGRSQAGMRWAS